MTRPVTDDIRNRLALPARLSEISQLPRWLEGLASLHAIPDDVLLAIDLCLEEAVSNIIRHGYGAEVERPVILRFTMPHPASYVFIVEDEAPLFNPLEAPGLTSIGPSGEVRIGGRGIRLLRRFTDTLEYEATATGNRLRMCFSVAGLAVRERSLEPRESPGP